MTCAPGVDDKGCLAILPLGLAADRRYTVRMPGGGALPAAIPAVATGLYWMTQGIRAPLKGDFVGAALVFKAML